MEVRRTTLDLHCSYMLFGLCDHPVGGQELVITSCDGRFSLVGRSDLKQSTQRMVADHGDDIGRAAAVATGGRFEH